MPPRIPALTCLRAAQPSQSQFALPLRTRPFSSTSELLAKTTGRPNKRISQDPYLVAQRARKKAANLSRRGDLEQQRVESLGDPVRGVSTPFVESFLTGKPLSHPEGAKIPKDEFHLNYALKPEILEGQLIKSKDLAVPRAELDAQSEAPTPQFPWSNNLSYNQARTDETKDTSKADELKETDHARAAEAIARITALDNGSSKDRMRVNITRCVSTFGRHNTDHLLPPRAPPLASPNSPIPHAIRPETNAEAATSRIGPDTGSSEVQIAILTAKIKTVKDFLETRGKHDKHNKRNLRLLVHRRQKLLKYLRTKERGGPRWQHCIETLGLTEGTWRGEISL